MNKQRILDLLSLRKGQFKHDFVVGMAGVVAKALSVSVNGGAFQKQRWPWQSGDIRGDIAQQLRFGLNDFLLLNGAVPQQAPENVVSSIIIPVWNNADLTFDCLRSLFRNVDTTRHEIIVVDNASTDATPRLLDLWQGAVRVVRLPSNEGFVGACNRGAQEARGKYLVFLNNDTVVLPGWLDALVATVETNPRAGAVGSMLIFPDGRLQEAGGIIWRDGTGANYGRDQDPNDGRFGFARSVDYCSGASLLVRRDLFSQLNGFDERYAPAYYEDTDLCFGVRALGYEVIYQPQSRVVHFEGATAGTNPGSGAKRFQGINRVKFVDKWRDTLERDHFDSAAGQQERASNRKRGLRILYVDLKIPTPDQDAGSSQMSFMLALLNEWAQVVFTPVDPRTEPRYEAALAREGIQVAPVSQLKEIAQTQPFDVAILKRPVVAQKMYPLVRRLNPNIKIIFETTDIHFVRLERQAQVSGQPVRGLDARDFKKIETKLARECDQVWCITPDDAGALGRACPTAKIVIVPQIQALNGRGQLFAARNHLLFIGGFMHLPNVDAVKFYAQDIAPLVREKVPDAKLLVVGSAAPPDVLALEGDTMSLLGYVPDVDPLFESCRVFVAPLRYGAGMKGKITQALSYGLPVVTTSIGAEGIGLRDGEECLIADTPDEFARAVTRLYNDSQLWQRLSDNGFRFLEERFTPEVIGSHIKETIEQLCAEKSNT